MTASTLFPQLSQGTDPVYPAPVKSVEPGSPAERAGVRPGDLLLRVNGEALTDVLAYRHALQVGVATLQMSRPAEVAPVALGFVPQDHHVTKQSEGELTYSFQVDWEDPGIDFEEVLFDGIRK